MPISEGIEIAKPIELASLIDYVDEDISSKKILENDSAEVVLYALDEDEEIEMHDSEGDLFVTCLEGEGTVDICTIESHIKPGSAVFVAIEHPYAIYADGGTKLKVMVTIVK